MATVHSLLVADPDNRALIRTFLTPYLLSWHITVHAFLTCAYAYSASWSAAYAYCFLRLLKRQTSTSRFLLNYSLLALRTYENQDPFSLSFENLRNETGGEDVTSGHISHQHILQVMYRNDLLRRRGGECRSWVSNLGSSLGWSWISTVLLAWNFVGELTSPHPTPISTA